LAGRRVNDSMGEYVAQQVIKLMLKKGIQVLGSEIFILGFTFKENCPDVRNTKVIDIVKALKEFDLNVTIYDPWANPEVAMHEYGIEVKNKMPKGKFDAVILAVAHEEFKVIEIPNLTSEKFAIFDVKGIMNYESIDGRL